MPGASPTRKATGYAALQLSWGVGTLLGLAVLPRLSPRVNAGRIILSGWALWGAGTCGLGLTQSAEVAALLVGASGIGNMLAVIPSITLVQQLTPADLRGRVFGVRYSLAFLSLAIASALTGSLADVTGVEALSLAMGGTAVAFVGLGFLWSDLREAV